MTSTVLPDLLARRDFSACESVRTSAHSDPRPLLQALAAHHSDLLLTFIGKFTAEPDEAHDLLQDVWLQVLRKGSSYAGRGSFLGWVLSVARNTCLSALRRPARRNACQPAALSGIDASAWGNPDKQTPETLLVQKELRGDLYKAIQNLAPRQRAVVVLRLVEGASTRETAAELGCSPGTVKGTLFRAKRQLRRELAHWQA